MCGIVGFFCSSNNNSFADDLEIATQVLKHRGPDQTGLYRDTGCNHQIGLGHCRLSVIDLSEAGTQPMHSADGRIVVVYNGEIYNFKALRNQLEQRGYLFHSQTDTEVIINAYLEWGIKCVEQFIGMFAIGIYDKPARKLVLIRDRLGIKPVYYYCTHGELIFASELKSLMAFNCFPKTINSDALALFLHYQYVPAPQTIYNDTYKLLPGHYMVFDGRHLHQKPYWSPPERLDCDGCNDVGDEVKYIDELDELLTNAVSDRLISDVPIGALLSGGIDSSLVVALMQKANPSPVRTFSIGFSEDKYNEAPWARKIAAHLGTDHTELYVSPVHALDVIAKLPDIYDEPFADSSSIPTYLVSKLTRSHVTVALSGDGGDEQFAGYVRYWMTRTIEKWFARIPERTKSVISGILGGLPVSWIESFYLPLRDYLPQRLRVENFQEKWQNIVMQLAQEQLSELYRMTISIWPSSDLAELIGQSVPESMYESIFNDTSGWPTISRLMRVDQSTYLSNCMLTKVDRASMAASLEVRVPLLDHRVVEYSYNIPETLKYRDGCGKYVLKKVLARYVPRSLFERPKMGFGVPIDQWFRNELKELLLDYLSPAMLKKEGRFNSNLIEKKINEHLDGTCNHHYRLWAILMWEMWRERWLS
jgi:asparagine synthase (glutamine-hydrolysing)